MLKLNLKLAAGLIIVALVLIFTLQNMTKVPVRFITGGPWTIPLAYLLFASVLFGMGLVGIAFLIRTFILKGMRKKVLVQQEALRQISRNLMVQPREISNTPQPALLPQSQSQLQPEELPPPSKGGHIASTSTPRASVENTVENRPAHGLPTSPNARKDKIRNLHAEEGDRPGEE